MSRGPSGKFSRYRLGTTTGKVRERHFRVSCATRFAEIASLAYGAKPTKVRKRYLLSETWPRSRHPSALGQKQMHDFWCWFADFDQSIGAICGVLNARPGKWCQPKELRDDRSTLDLGAPSRKSVRRRAFRAHDGRGLMETISCVSCWDNAVAESFFGTVTKELLIDGLFETRGAASRALFDSSRSGTTGNVGTRR